MRCNPGWEGLGAGSGLNTGAWNPIFSARLRRWRRVCLLARRLRTRISWTGTEGPMRTRSGGNPVSCAAALEVINAIRDEHLMENATKQGDYMIKRLKEMQEKYDIIGDVRGKGR